MDSLYQIFVRSYCLREVPDAEFHALIEDIYFTEEVQSLERFPQHSTVNRLNHITAVAYMTYCLAKRFGCDRRNSIIQRRMRQFWRRIPQILLRRSWQQR